MWVTKTNISPVIAFFSKKCQIQVDVFTISLETFYANSPWVFVIFQGHGVTRNDTAIYVEMVKVIFILYINSNPSVCQVPIDADWKIHCGLEFNVPDSKRTFPPLIPIGVSIENIF